MEPGQLLGDRYRLDERVDGGGMGDVWRGRDTRLDRTVAIKVLHAGLSGDTTFRQRFHGEARAVAALQAPGVVNLFDYGEDTASNTGVVSYLVMEFVDGKSLRHLLSERETLPVDEVLDIVAQSADALDSAHQSGIVHRDVKPGNILIKPNTGQVKIVDFGIARARGASSLTETGTIMGSVSYVSPEQLYGQELTGASDVYSLGIVAYECLAGVKPFPGDVPATIISEQLHKTPDPLPAVVPAAVAETIMRALEKDPANRWASAAEFAAACRGLQSTGPIKASEVDPDATAIVPTGDPEAKTTILNTPDDAKTTTLAASNAAAAGSAKATDRGETNTKPERPAPPSPPPVRRD
ncbi:MAG: serine/threonine-protein kinase, partial [Stackebrandtia sp.]